MVEAEPGRKHRTGSGRDADNAPPEDIVAIPLRHPWRILVAVLLVLGLAVFVLDAAQRPDYGWADVGKFIFDRRISQAALLTLSLTIYAMVGAIVIGLLLAIMRLSPNPVLKSIAWLYIWIFRGTPVYVQLVFWGIVSLIYPVFTLGIPFTDPWVTIPNGIFTNLFVTAVIGLALNEAAYMSEIGARGPAVRGPGPGGSLDGAGHVLGADHAVCGGPAGHEDHHPAHRQRGDLDAENHVAGGRDPLEHRPLRGVPRHFRGDVHAGAAADCGVPLVPALHLHPDGGPAFH